MFSYMALTLNICLLVVNVVSSAERSPHKDCDQANRQKVTLTIDLAFMKHLAIYCC